MNLILNNCGLETDPDAMDQCCEGIMDGFTIRFWLYFVHVQISQELLGAIWGTCPKAKEFKGVQK